MMTKIEADLKRLGSLSREELVVRWQGAYGCPPPAGARRELLLYAAGWNIQAKRQGGFSREVKRMLRREVERIKCETQPEPGLVSAGDDLIVLPSDVSTSGEPNSSSAGDRRTLSPGVRLLREWNGQPHVVDVTDGGYLYDGTTYRSLSAIARHITGAHWSGPRFFGL